MAAVANAPLSRFRVLWSQKLPAAPRGLALAREKGWLLAWDQADWLYLFNRRGERQAQWHAPAALAGACAADDGSAFAAAGRDGRAWWLAPDFSLRWEQALDAPLLCVAMDPFGQYLAAADQRRRLHLLDRFGRAVSCIEIPRPLHHVAFVPAAAALVGSADYGLVGCVDLAGKLLWRDGLVAHTGSLAADGAGDLVLLACFSEGLRAYAVSGKHRGRLPFGEPCRLASVSFDGRLILAADLTDRLLLIDPSGRTLATHRCKAAPTAIVLAALGDSAVIALADGTLTSLAIDSA